MAGCPCGSGLTFHECCRPLIRGTDPAPTATAFMRSRYTAYVLRDESYLLRTWHPGTRPGRIDLDGVTWRGLDILATSKGEAADALGTVTFVAHYASEAGQPATMRETSRFETIAGAWVYVDGDVD